MVSKLTKSMTGSTTKERLRAKVDAKEKEKEKGTTAFCNMSDTHNHILDEALETIFSSGENVEKTPRGAKPPLKTTGKKKKKGHK